MGFKKVEDELREILRTDEGARCDDMQLYVKYVKSKGIDDIPKVFENMRYRVINCIAPYESVSRVRRKLQEKDETLRPPKGMVELKKERVKAYKAYAKER